MAASFGDPADVIAAIPDGSGDGAPHLARMQDANALRVHQPIEFILSAG